MRLIRIGGYGGVNYLEYVSRKRRRQREGKKNMKGKRYRRYANGCIYEVLERADNSAVSTNWILWNDRFSERVLVPEAELLRQVGWDLVGSSQPDDGADKDTRPAPAALMK